QIMNEDVVRAGLAEARDIDVQLGVDRLTHRHPAPGDLAYLLAGNGDAETPGFHHGEDVADADRDVHRDLADPLDLDALIGDSQERGRPFQCDLDDAIAVPADHGLDETSLGVDEDRRLHPVALHTPRPLGP